MTDSLLPPYPSAEEAAAMRAHKRARADAGRDRWTGDVISKLDWRKIVEAARALAVTAGWEPGGTRVSPDGMAEFGMTKGSGSMVAHIWVRLAPWNRWLATPKCIDTFAADVAPHQGVRGTYMAPGGVTPAARTKAGRLGIEVLDAEAMAMAMNGLPPAHSDFFHELTLSGQAFVPSCPVCLRLLSQSMESEERGATGKLPDLSYGTNDVVDEVVVARRIEVLRNCEVHFRSGVRARDVSVQGVVNGDFVCEGSLQLEPGGMLTGSVAARSVLVRPGAELHGETRILNGTLGAGEEPARWVWTCQSPRQQKGCERVCFLPH